MGGFGDWRGGGWNTLNVLLQSKHDPSFILFNHFGFEIMDVLLRERFTNTIYCQGIKTHLWVCWASQGIYKAWFIHLPPSSSKFYFVGNPWSRESICLREFETHQLVNVISLQDFLKPFEIFILCRYILSCCHNDQIAAKHFKDIYTFGNCQRPVFSLVYLIVCIK